MDYPNVSMTLPPEVLKKYLNRTFVETGSYDGRTIQMALDCGFIEVRSVEVSPYYSQICQERFGNVPYVHLYTGDSTHTLRDMLADIQEPVTFWLDAHIQEGYKGDVDDPLLKELLIIIECFPYAKQSTFMIDDRRLMGTYVWPHVTELQVINTLLMINPDFIICFEDNNVAKDDIIVAKPRR